MGHFQGLTSELAFPIPLPGEAPAAFDARIAAYEAGITNASFDVFRSFFRAGAVLSVLAAIPALWLHVPPSTREEVGSRSQRSRSNE